MQPKYSATHPISQQAPLRPWFLSFTPGGKWLYRSITLRRFSWVEAVATGYFWYQAVKPSGCCHVSSPVSLLPPQVTQLHISGKRLLTFKCSLFSYRKLTKERTLIHFLHKKLFGKELGFQEQFLGVMESQITARHCQSRGKAGEIQGFYL